MMFFYKNEMHENLYHKKKKNNTDNKSTVDPCASRDDLV